MKRDHRTHKRLNSAVRTAPLSPGNPEQVVLELGRALHSFGTPAHRIERVLENVSEKFGLEAQFFAVPTAIHAAFGPLGNQRGGLVRLEPSGVDLGKISLLDEEVRHLAAGRQTPEEALAEIRRIEARPSPFAAWLRLICFGFASGAAASFFGGGLREIAASTLVGFVLGMLSRFMENGPKRHAYVPLAAALGATLAQLGTRLFGEYQVEVVTVAGLLYLLPGMTLTTALTELSTWHLVSGTARFTVAILILLELAFGVAAGGQLAALFTGMPGKVLLPEVNPIWVTPVAIVVASLSYVVLFRARLRDAPWIVAACALAFYASRGATLILGPQLGAWLGVFVAVVACNAYARLLDRPPSVPLVPAVLLIVPGSIGLKSITLLLQEETIRAVDAAFDMVIIAMALAIGTLMANFVISPRRDL